MIRLPLCVVRMPLCIVRIAGPLCVVRIPGPLCAIRMILCDIMFRLSWKAKDRQTMTMYDNSADVQ